GSVPLDGRSFGVEIIPPSGSPWAVQEAMVSFVSCAAAIRLAEAVPVDGEVLGMDKATVPARVVVTRDSGIPGRPPVTASATTNASGAFHLDLIPGTHRLRVIPQAAAATS